MNINSFYSHNLNERIDLVNRNAEFISRIKYYGFFVNLYIYDRTMIEVYYNIHSNKIQEVEILDPKDERLNQYVVQVNLSDLYTKNK